jgi:hypothetical protein
LIARRWLLALLIFGVVIRVGLWTHYEPASYPDTGTYYSAAQDLLEGGLAHSEGRRTPGYPLLIAVAGIEPRTIILLQMFGGLITSALLFYMALATAGPPWFAFIIGMTYNLNLQQLFLEATLMSESTSTLTIVATVALTIRACALLREGRKASLLLLFLGALVGAAVLVRPQYVFLPLVLPVFIAFASGAPRIVNRYVLANTALTATPAIVIIFAWCTFVFLKTGYFTLTTQSGFSLVNHSVAFAELASDRYATIRDILLRYREINLAEKGHYGNTGWLALPEIRRTTGMSIPEASRELQRMSADLFVAHPSLYALSVARSWIDFWTVPILLKPENLAPSWLAVPVSGVWWLEHKALRFANLVFVLLVCSVIVSRRARTITNWNLHWTIIAAVVLFSSVIQALADYGASSRYAMTIQALVLFAVLAMLREVVGNLAPNTKRGESASLR